MSENWKDSNLWINENIMSSRFWFNNWKDFTNQSPFESNIWKQRGIRLLSWSVDSPQKDINTIQIVFMVNSPDIEIMYFEVVIKNSDEPTVRAWLAERIPPFWKNLLPS